MDALGVPLPVLLVLFPTGLVLTLAGLTVQLVPSARSGIRRAGAVVAVIGALLYALGGSYPGSGAAWALGAAVAVVVGLLAALPLLPAVALPARTRRNAPAAALVLALLDLHVLLDQPPASGLAVTLALMVAVGWAALRPAAPLPRRRHRLAVAAAVVLVSAGAFAWRMADSRHPGSFSLADHGGHTGHGAHGVPAAAPAPVAPQGTGAARRFTVTALPDGDRLRFEPAELRFVEGERVEVAVRNGLAESTSVHWHGMRVPNAMDGVSGLTQDAIPPGGTFTYRFEVPDDGTYWFHAHQDSARQVARGLFGAVVVTPAAEPASGVDRAVLLQSVADRLVLTDADRAQRADAPPGSPVRLRVVNTDDMDHAVTLRGAPFAVAALDGSDLDGASPLTSTSVTVPAGGRADLVYTQPGGTAAVLQSIEEPGALYRTSGPGRQVPDPPAAGELRAFDADGYGTRRPDDVRDAAAFDVDLTVRMTTKFGFYDGAFGTYSFIDDRLYPHGRMLMVRPGDLVRVRLENRSYLIHPMHLHGHSMTVLEHDGRPVTGATRRLDSLQMRPGETWTVAFRADNPGLWMFHCHNLQHAVDGMDLMLGYEGATTPFRAGSDTGNKPE